MILISHRGNVNGTNPELENSPSHISLVSNKWNVEIDVWVNKNGIFLGHDSPQYEVDLNFLQIKNLWCHAKNLEAFELMLKNKINCFWHQTDDFTLTSSGFIWTFPNKNVTSKSIIVDIKKNWIEKNYNCYGVCTDYIIYG
jgi:hypothetical protein